MSNSVNSILPLIKSTSLSKSQLLQLHGHIICSSLIKEPTVVTSLLSLLALSSSPLRDIHYSHQIFTQIPKPTFHHYNVMIRAYSLSNSPEKGVLCYNQMRNRDTL
ncbi:hypothetical protein MKX01_008007 [Papaver californicum]|nr:hypothetical protein MKX01_008007 [Papaver californicum]